MLLRRQTARLETFDAGAPGIMAPGARSPHVELLPTKLKQVSLEPLMATYREVGRLCTAWAFVEMLTEVTLLGVLDLSVELTETLIWPMTLQKRWATITKAARSKLPPEAANAARRLEKMVRQVGRDRNIVVHGLVHAKVFSSGDVREVCWTIFMGEDAGRNFPVSVSAARIIRLNAQQLGSEIGAFNIRHGFNRRSAQRIEVERDWPKPLLPPAA